jgi:hypothetical protein
MYRVLLTALLLAAKVHAGDPCDFLPATSSLCVSPGATTAAFVFTEETGAIDDSEVASPGADESVLFDIVQKKQVTVTNSDGVSVNFTNSNYWVQFSNQLYVAGESREFTVTTSNGESYQVDSFDMMAYGESARGMEGTPTSDNIAQQTSAGYGTLDLFVDREDGLSADEVSLRSKIITDTQVNASQYSDVEVEHKKAIVQLALRKLENLPIDSSLNTSLTADELSQWQNNLIAAGFGADGDTLTDANKFVGLVDALEVGSEISINSALDAILSDYTQNSEYLQSFGPDSNAIGEALYLYPVALQQAVTYLEENQGKLSVQQLQALNAALVSRFEKTGFDTDSAVAMSAGILGDLDSFYTGTQEGLVDLFVSSISGQYGLDPDDVSSWFDNITSNQLIALSQGLYNNDDALIQQTLADIASANNVSLDAINEILNDQLTNISAADIVNDFDGAPNGGGGLGERFKTGAEQLNGTLRSWLSFDLKLTPDWSDVMVQALYRSLGQPFAYVYKNVLQGEGAESESELGSASPPILLAFQFGAAIGASLLGFFVTYTLIVGIYKTAKTGSFLGEEVSSFMHPVRSTYAMMLLMPVPMAGGMTVASLFLIAFIIISIGLSSSIAVAFSAAALQEPVFVMDREVDENMGSDLLKSMVCMYTLRDFNLLKDGEEQASEIFTALPLWDPAINDYQPLLVLRPETKDRWVNRFWQKLTGTGEYIDPLSVTGDVRTNYINDVRKDGLFGDNQKRVTRVQFGNAGRCGQILVADGHIAGEAQVLIDTYAALLEENFNPKLDQIAVALNASVMGFEKALNDPDHRFRQVGTVMVKEINGDRESLPFIMSKSVEDTQIEIDNAHNLWKQQIMHSLYQVNWKAYKRNFLTRKADELDYFDIACLIVEGEDCYDEGGYKEGEKLFIKTATPEQARNAAQFILNTYYGELENGLSAAFKKTPDTSNDYFLDTMEKMGAVSIAIIPWMIELRQEQYEEFYDFSTMARYRGPLVNKSLLWGSDKRASIDFGNKKFNSAYTTNMKMADFSGGDPLSARIDEDLRSMVLNNSINKGTVGPSQYISELVGKNMLSLIGDINNSNAMPISRLRGTGDVITATMLGLNLRLSMFFGATQGAAEGSVAHISPYNVPAGLLELLKTFFGPLIGLMPQLLMVGFLLSNIVPLLPTLLFIFSIVGMLAYHFEAIFAVNLGVAMKGHHDGDDLIGKGGNIYPIILTCIFRFPFIIIGYIFGTTIHVIGFHLITAILLPASLMANSPSDGWPGMVNLLSWAGLIVVWAAAQVALAWKAYGMCIEFPNAAFRWWGINDHQDLGEREGSTKAAAVITQGAGYMGAPSKDGSSKKAQEDKAAPGGGVGGVGAVGAEKTGPEKTPF